MLFVMPFVSMVSAGEWVFQPYEYNIPDDTDPSEPGYTKSLNNPSAAAGVLVGTDENKILFVYGYAVVTDPYCETEGGASLAGYGAVWAKMRWVPSEPSKPASAGNLELVWMGDTISRSPFAKGWAELDCKAWAKETALAQVDSATLTDSDDDKWICKSDRQVILPANPVEGKELTTTLTDYLLAVAGLPGGITIDPEKAGLLIDVAFDRGSEEWAHGDEAFDTQIGSGVTRTPVGPGLSTSHHARAIHGASVDVGGRGDGHDLFDSGDFGAETTVEVRTATFEIEFIANSPEPPEP
jgi:hypothetical protein